MRSNDAARREESPGMLRVPGAIPTDGLWLRHSNGPCPILAFVRDTWDQAPTARLDEVLPFFLSSSH